MRARRLLSVAALLLLVLASLPWSPGPVRAVTLTQAQQQLQEIESRLAHDKAMLQQTAGSLAGAQQAIAQVHQSLDRTTAALDNALNWEATLGKRIKSSEVQIQATQKALAGDQAVMGRTLRLIEQEGPAGYLGVLFGAQSFADFEVRLSLLEQIIRADIAVIRQVQQRRQALRQEQRTLTAQRAQYAAVAAVRRKAQSALQQQFADQQQAVAQLDRRYALQTSAVHTDEGDSQEITQIIQGLQSHGSGAGIRGIHFIWPVVGPITSPYGWRLDPVMHQWWIHTGVDIGVPWGTPIHAAASGRVILAQWLNGYGYTIIIDDGDGIANLYAHQERFNVHVGEPVQQGQIIGFVGATGWATGPHLHFEVRINGNPVNPMSYMPPMP